ncbi:MAG: hypothetical protein IPP71_12440 [Bacteroidetes bacterium]|nr:hypothetical protein [Bacteroidota bacterium]
MCLTNESGISIGDFNSGTLFGVNRFQITNGLEPERRAISIYTDPAGTFNFWINSSQDLAKFKFMDGSNDANLVEIRATGHVLIGNPSFDTNYQLLVCGGIKAKKLRIPSQWCDYVFKPDYDLLSIKDLESFISENHHLPGIPYPSDQPHIVKDIVIA